MVKLVGGVRFRLDSSGNAQLNKKDLALSQRPELRELALADQWGPNKTGDNIRRDHTVIGRGDNDGWVSAKEVFHQVTGDWLSDQAKTAFSELAIAAEKGDFNSISAAELLTGKPYQMKATTSAREGMTASEISSCKTVDGVRFRIDSEGNAQLSARDLATADDAALRELALADHWGSQRTEGGFWSSKNVIGRGNDDGWVSMEEIYGQVPSNWFGEEAKTAFAKLSAMAVLAFWGDNVPPPAPPSSKERLELPPGRAVDPGPAPVSVSSAVGPAAEPSIKLTIHNEVPRSYDDSFVNGLQAKAAAMGLQIDVDKGDICGLLGISRAYRIVVTGDESAIDDFESWYDVTKQSWDPGWDG